MIFTNLPTIPLTLIGGSCIGMALMLTRQKQQAEVAAIKAKDEAKKPEDRIEDYLATDPMEIEIGLGLIRLADPKRGGDLLQRIQRVRQSIAADLGMIMPKVRVRDNMQLDQTQYQIKVAGVAVAQGTLEPVMLLAIHTGSSSGTLRGIQTSEPTTGACHLD